MNQKTLLALLACTYPEAAGERLEPGGILPAA